MVLLKKRFYRLLGYEIDEILAVGGGGAEAPAFQVKTYSDIFFIKRSTPEMIEAEMDGLETLSKACEKVGLYVPRLHSVDKKNGFIALEWLESAVGRESQNSMLGRKLAKLHALDDQKVKGYGYHRDNFIGPTPQDNTNSELWPTFFYEKRLYPMMDHLLQNGLWQNHWGKPFENLAKELKNILPNKPHPSLVHGDLWGGNVMFLTDGRTALIDPAVYVGHREVDLAMMQLFGGFDQSFMENYQDTWKLEKGWKKRFDVYNLYHLMNHLLLFGQSYQAQVDEVISRYK